MFVRLIEALLFQQYAMQPSLGMDGVQISCEVVCVFAKNGFTSRRRRTFW